MSLAHFVTVAISANQGLIRLKKSSRKLSSPYIFNFVNNLYLVLHACVHTFDMMRLKFSSQNQTGPNTTESLKLQ
jgi:hypothetical protein